MRNLFPLPLLLCFLLPLAVVAQDPHFSDYTHNPLGLGPGMTGLISENSSRLQTGYRSQWHTVLDEATFQTAYATFDRRFCIDNQGNYWGLGLSVLGDRRGSFSLSRSEAYLSGSFVRKLSGSRGEEGTYLGAGAELGFIHHALGNGERTFDEQFDDPTAPGELVDRAAFTMLDYGLGLQLISTWNSSNNIPTGISFGGTIKHLGLPVYEFRDQPAGEEDRLNRRYIVHFGGVFAVGRSDGLSLQVVLHQQTPFRQGMLNVGYVRALKAKTLLRFTTGWRQVRSSRSEPYGDAVVLSTSLLLNGISFGASYDMNISPLRTASQAVGAFEFTFGYRFGQSDCRLFCPTF